MDDVQMVRVRAVLVRMVRVRVWVLVLQKMIAVCSPKLDDDSLLAVALQVEAVLVIVLTF